MKVNSRIKAHNLRKERNANLLRRMRNGDQLSSFNSYSSWFPPRPIIEKDERAVQELYGRNSNSSRRANFEGSENASHDEHLGNIKPLRLA